MHTKSSLNVILMKWFGVVVFFTLNVAVGGKADLVDRNHGQVL